MCPGVSNPKVIDLIAQSPAGDMCLIMVQDKDWDGSEERLLELQAKVNAYLAYALDGQLCAQYPQARGKRVRIELHCDDPPDPRTQAFLERVMDETRRFGIEFSHLVR